MQCTIDGELLSQTEVRGLMFLHVCIALKNNYHAWRLGCRDDEFQVQCVVLTRLWCFRECLADVLNRRLQLRNDDGLQVFVEAQVPQFCLHHVFGDALVRHCNVQSHVQKYS